MYVNWKLVLALFIICALVIVLIVYSTGNMKIEGYDNLEEQSQAFKKHEQQRTYANL